MATTPFNETRFIHANSNPVTLRITVGQMQAGGSYVTFFTSAGVQAIQPNANGDYVFQPQVNSIIRCVTTVQDINLNTNNTSVIHDFNSATPSQHNYDRTVEHQDDKVVYDIQYVFI